MALTSRTLEVRSQYKFRYLRCTTLDTYEDLANSLHEYARAQHYDLGISEDEVLSRCLAGLQAPASGVNEREAVRVVPVVRRLAELEGWCYSEPRAAN